MPNAMKENCVDFTPTVKERITEKSYQERFYHALEERV